MFILYKEKNYFQNNMTHYCNEQYTMYLFTKIFISFTQELFHPLFATAAL